MNDFYGIELYRISRTGVGEQEQTKEISLCVRDGGDW